MKQPKNNASSDVGVLLNDGNEITFSWEFESQQDFDQLLDFIKEAYRKVETASEVHENVRTWALINIVKKNLHGFKQVDLRKYNKVD